MSTRRRAQAPPQSPFSSANGFGMINGYSDLPTTVHPLKEGSVVKSRRPFNVEVPTRLKKTNGFEKVAVRGDEKVRASSNRVYGMMLLFLINLTVIVIFVYLRQPHRKLEFLPPIQEFLTPAKPMLGKDYVVFVTASTTHAGGTYVRLGRSNSSAIDALRHATRQLPQTKIFKWFQVDYVTGMQRLTNFNYERSLSERFGDWFGIGLNWDEQIVFLPAQIKANSLIDRLHFLRWERLALWMHQHNPKKLRELAPDYSDDSTFLEQLDLFHTKSIFIDLSDSHHHPSVVPLEYGHRLFYDSKLSPQNLRRSSISTGKYLMQISEKESSMVSYYLPRSHYIEYTHQSSEHWHGYAESLYALSLLFQSWRDSRVLHSISVGVNFLLNNHLSHCPLANGNHMMEGMCLRDYENKSTLLRNNAMLLISLVEFYEASASNDQELIKTMLKIANFIEGSYIDQKNLFLRTVEFEDVGSIRLTLDSDKKEISSEAQAAFSLLRLISLLQNKRYTFRKEWKEISLTSIQKLVENELHDFAEDQKRDFVPDHWLLHAIAQAYSIHGHNEDMLHYANRSVRFTTKYQIQKRPTDKSERIDLLGSFLHDPSALAAAQLSHGLCSVHPMVEEQEELMSSLELSAKFQMQYQFRPETAMWLRDPQRILGGMHEGHDSFDMSMVDSAANIMSFLCISKLMETR
jgi:hypothetical protein